MHDEAVWDHLAGTTSAPFEAGDIRPQVVAADVLRRLVLKIEPLTAKVRNHAPLPVLQFDPDKATAANEHHVGERASLSRYFTRRKVDPGALDYKDPEKAAGNKLRQVVTIKQGIDAELARRLVKELKGSKLKVQAAIQGDELRITGKKRDELQEAIAAVRGLKIPQPLQFVNFRD